MDQTVGQRTPHTQWPDDCFLQDGLLTSDAQAGLITDRSHRDIIRILHVFPSFAQGGSQIRTCHLIDALGDGYFHSIMAIDGVCDACQRLKDGTPAELVPPPPGKGGALYFTGMMRTLRQVRPDLLITYNWGAFDALLAGLFSRVCPVLHAEDGFGKDEAVRLKRRRVWARRLTLNHTAGVVVPSRTLRDLALGDYGVSRNKVQWIVNGVDTQRFSPGTNPLWREQYGIPPEHIVFGYVGRLSAEKNLTLLLRAFAQAGIPDAWLVLAGDGPARRETELEARTLPGRGRIVFTGHVDDPSGLYRALDGFVLSSRTEQMPVSILEAMASGLPVIATDVGDAAEMLEAEEPPVVVPSGDTEAFAHSMRTLAGSAELRRALAQRNRSACVRRYSMEKMVAQYRDLYSSVKPDGKCRPQQNW